MEIKFWPYSISTGALIEIFFFDPHVCEKLPMKNSKGNGGDNVKDNGRDLLEIRIIGGRVNHKALPARDLCRLKLKERKQNNDGF